MPISKKWFSFKAIWQLFFGTKIENSKQLCSRGKTIFRFSNNCSSFKWFQSSLTHFFETKNVNCVAGVKRFLDFPITAPVSEQNCTIFILGSYLFEFHPRYTAKADYQTWKISGTCNEKNTRTYGWFVHLQKNSFCSFKIEKIVTKNENWQTFFGRNGLFWNCLNFHHFFG